MLALRKKIENLNNFIVLKEEQIDKLSHLNNEL